MTYLSAGVEEQLYHIELLKYDTILLYHILINNMDDNPFAFLEQTNWGAPFLVLLRHTF